MRATVSAGGLEFPAEGMRGALAGAKPGDMVNCVIRPESAALDPGAEGPTFPVLRRVFQGMQMEYHLDFAESGLLVFDTGKSVRLKPGERVPLDLTRATAWIVSEAGGEPA